MLSQILDAVREYQEAQDRRTWIGNERMQELEYDFSKQLAKIIDARIKSALTPQDKKQENEMDQSK